MVKVDKGNVDCVCELFSITTSISIGDNNYNVFITYKNGGILDKLQVFTSYGNSIVLSDDKMQAIVLEMDKIAMEY